MQLIKKHFPNLTEIQEKQFLQLQDHYQFWNDKINVISRKDMDNFYERHVLHSLGIAKVIKFKKGTKILDIGTGGGFPGIPLAILFPESSFTLVDSIGKKIKVVQAIAQSIGLTNVTAIHTRAENIQEQFDFIISRAVTAMAEFINWTKGKISPINFNEYKNGILYLKGGDIVDEMKLIQQEYEISNLQTFFESPFFETKKVVYVNLSKSKR